MHSGVINCFVDGWAKDGSYDIKQKKSNIILCTLCFSYNKFYKIHIKIVEFIHVKMRLIYLYVN